jgi:hypothetical protein
MEVGYYERSIALMSKCSMQVEGEDDVQLGSVEPSLIMELKRVSLLIQKLIKSRDDAFEIQVVGENGNAHVVTAESGKLLQQIIKSYAPMGNGYKTLYQYEPYIEMAFNQIAKSELSHTYLIPRSAVHTEDAKAIAHRLNKCVDDIRKEAKSKRFESALSSYRRSSNKNYKELNKYVDALFERYSRLLVLRVDLSYSKDHSKTTQDQAKRDREHLLKNTRSNKLFNDMVGYIWKLEHGPEKGFHYHVMFFFDGSKVREDVTRAILIGRYWKEIITQGRGLYFNCNAGKHNYKSCGIGMVNHADDELREGLRKAVVYLTKTDLYMKLQTEGRSMGRMNNPSPKSSRGRPRAVPTMRAAA